MKPPAAIWLAAAVIPFTHAGTFYSALNVCPQSCDISGPSPSNWTHHHKPSAFSRCDQTVLFDLALNNPIGAEDTDNTLRACSANAANTSAEPVHKSAAKRASQGVTTIQAEMHVSRTGSKISGAAGNITAAAIQLQAVVDTSDQVGPTILFAKSGSALVGVYAGVQIEKQDRRRLIQKFVDHVNANGDMTEQISAQVCPKSNAVSSQVFGIFANLHGDIGAVQKALKSWDNGECVGGWDLNDSFKVNDVGIRSVVLTTPQETSKRALSIRSTCKYVQVGGGDGCWALAQKCGISQDKLKKYNKKGFCDSPNPKAGDYACCSSGTLPDFSPKPNKDGSCASYTVQPTDLCHKIAAAHSMTADKIEKVNKDTWGWAGCGNLQQGQIICLSSGSPPMPAPLPNAVCGPQVAGTRRPALNIPLEYLNPCPLNACCDKWGQCGITPEFCTKSRPKGAPPGVSKPGTNGCISFCGTDITNNKDKPDSWMQVGYFEAWNMNRPCLNMDVSKINADTKTIKVNGHKYSSFGYTHVHFAFGNITTDYKVDVSGAKDQFDGFLKLKDIKRILSFGGWAFSTAPDTFPIFRLGVTDANRQLFAKNVAQFAIDNDLDGLDFDWEYPGAPDIPGVPPGDPGDGKRYLEFLKMVRDLLPKGKTLSIAAPASYWYLKGFPIKEISDVVDYIIYMTYDLHGQWDYNNPWANPGCPTGNCLRSQVNKTETEYALAMITKAGVPAKKVIGGMALYGRSFEMTEAGCTGPSCTFTGPMSGAAKGKCTDTAGYISNYEINQIISSSNVPLFGGNFTVNKQYHDEGDVLVYNDKQWVSYMSPTTYNNRVTWLKDSNFGGTSDWAMDLNDDYGSGGKGNKFDGKMTVESMCDFSKKFKDLDDLEAHAGSIQDGCEGVYVLDVLLDMLDKAYKNYTSINTGYDDKYDAYVRYVKAAIPSAVDSLMVDGDGLKYFDCQYDDYDRRNKFKKPCADINKGDLFGTYRNYRMVLTLRDKDGFNSAILNKGIDPSWVTLTGTYKHEPNITPGHPTVAGSYYWHNYPKEVDDLKVENPKDIITKGIGKIDTVRKNITASWADMVLGSWDGSYTDVAQVMSVPVFMLEQAVDSMATVKKIGKEQLEREKKAKKNLILAIIGLVLMFVPFVGEFGAAAVGAVTVGRAIAIIGETANAAFDVYSIAEDPSSALMSIMGMLVGAGGVVMAAREGKSFSKMAKYRMDFTSKGTAAKVGAVFTRYDAKLQKILKSC